MDSSHCLLVERIQLLSSTFQVAIQEYEQAVKSFSLFFKSLIVYMYFLHQECPLILEEALNATYKLSLFLSPLEVGRWLKSYSFPSLFFSGMWE